MGLLSELKSIKSTMNANAADSGLLKEITPEEKKQLQETLFAAYLEIKEVCERHGLDLFLLGGSALGAVRHNGFIPWDDDIDVCMSRQNYNKFVGIFEKELAGKYILNAPNYSRNARNRYPIILIRDSYYRRLIDTKDPSLHRIPIDLFIIDNYPDNPVRRKLLGWYVNFLEFMAGQVYLRENTNRDVKAYLTRNGSAAYNIRMIVGFLFSWRSSARWFDLIDRVIQGKNEHSKYCGTITGRKHYFGEMLEREVFFPAKRHEFNGTDAQVFNRVDLFLTRLFGDYMQVPPPEKRERHFFCELSFHEKKQPGAE